MAHHPSKFVLRITIIVVGELHGELLSSALQVDDCATLDGLGLGVVLLVMASTRFEVFSVDAFYDGRPEHEVGHLRLEEFFAAVLHAV